MFPKEFQQSHIKGALVSYCTDPDELMPSKSLYQFVRRQAYRITNVTILFTIYNKLRNEATL